MVGVKPVVRDTRLILYEDSRFSEEIGVDFTVDSIKGLIVQEENYPIKDGCVVFVDLRIGTIRHKQGSIVIDLLLWIVHMGQESI